MLANTTPTSTPSTWAQTKQQATLTRADAWGETWTRDDVEFVVEFTNEASDEDLALALGRTLYALWAIQHRIKHEGVAGVLDSLERRERRTRPVVERTYTFIDGDVPPGWDD